MYWSKEKGTCACNFLSGSVYLTWFKEAELAHLVKGVDVSPDHLGSSPCQGELGCLFSFK